ncbi:MAG TPA: IS200/IS605 family transposase [Chitinophagales bacterium]|nr:IS200/IS605 family transposase [Chitinophagales bacterium]
MANTYTQLYVQFVFAVKHRERLIPKKHKEELHKYITGIVQIQKHKMIKVNCMPEHAHVFVGMKPIQSVSNLIQDIKTNSTLFINDKNWFNGKFAWQDEYAAFTYGHSQIPDVSRYIENQEGHHRKKSFREEYMSFLKKFGIEYDERYLFEFFD